VDENKRRVKRSHDFIIACSHNTLPGPPISWSLWFLPPSHFPPLNTMEVGPYPSAEARGTRELRFHGWEQPEVARWWWWWWWWWNESRMIPTSTLNVDVQFKLCSHTQ